MSYLTINTKNHTSSKNVFLQFIKSYLQLITITNIKLSDKLIYCSYNLSIALRIHHLPIVDMFKLPKEISNSFAFQYFSQSEKDFIYACEAYNETLEFRQKNPLHKVAQFSTGKEISIIIYNPKDSNNTTKLTINDLSKFVGLCRRYKTPIEVEKIITSVFQ